MSQKRRKSETRKRPGGRQSMRDGRDEMNLIEFPFATLSERSNGRNVLEFRREVYDRVVGKRVLRQLTVTGDAKFGLPTAKDEEVYLGLLQLSKLYNDFSHPLVYFTRSQLIKLMNWRNRDWSYHRIGTAMRRLTGVRLFYEKAWRDNARRQYCDQGGFGLLDSFIIRDGRFRNKNADESERLSEFRWSSVVFGSFQSGYLKKLDYKTVRELSPVARRIYRYLDKHFYPPKRVSIVMDLKTFAFEHIGVSRSYDSTQIKRLFTQPIAELETIGFLAPTGNRFIKVKGQRAAWEVVFTMGGHRVPRYRGKAIPRDRNLTMPRDANSRHLDALDRQMAELSPSELRVLEERAMKSANPFFQETIEKHEPELG
ncbi:MAG: replication initiator protein A [Planctomycetota bacterium]